MPCKAYNHVYLGTIETLGELESYLNTRKAAGAFRIWLEGDFCGRRFNGHENIDDLLIWVNIERAKRRTK